MLQQQQETNTGVMEKEKLMIIHSIWIGWRAKRWGQSERQRHRGEEQLEGRQEVPFWTG